MAGGQQHAGISDFEKRILVQVRNGFAVVLGQFRLRVPKIDLARPAVHEQEDARFRLSRIMRLLGIKRRSGMAFGSGGRQKTVLGQEIGQRRAHETAAGLPEEFTPSATAGGQAWELKWHHGLIPRPTTCQISRSAGAKRKQPMSFSSVL